jgi:hypothetical protein
MAEYQNGTVIPCRAEYTDPDTGAFVDPTTVRVIVRDPLGVSTTYTYGVGVQLAQDSAGHYRINVEAITLGTWIIRFEADGTFEGAQEDSFYVY